MANKNKETLILTLALVITGGILAGVWSLRDKILPGSEQVSVNPPLNQNLSQNVIPGQAPKLDTSLPNPQVLTMDGSVTMVAIIKQLQLAYSLANPALPTIYGIPDGQPNGTNAGIKNLLNDKVAIAASSRPLKSEEIQAGLVGIPIARDAIAVAVGVNNPYQGGLTMEQLRGIFQGKITNWSEVGGPNAPIRVINRSPDSGTQSFFREVVLLGEAFPTNLPNYTTAEKDETAPLLRALGDNGITYSTVSQIEGQKTVRILPINGFLPTDRNSIKNGSYPISRPVYLVVKPKVSPATKDFIDFALSPRGQEVVARVGFVPLQ